LISADLVEEILYSAGMDALAHDKPIQWQRLGMRSKMADLLRSLLSALHATVRNFFAD
jgi:hypothetical protein